MKFNFKSLILLLVIVALVIAGVTYINHIMKQTEQITNGEVYKYFRDNKVIEVDIDKKALLTLKVVDKLGEDGKPAADAEIKEYTLQLSYTFQLEKVDNLVSKYIEEGYEITDSNGNKIRVESNIVENGYNLHEAAGTPWWQVILPYALAFIALIAIWFFLMRGAPGTGKMNNFAKSKAKVTGNDKDAVKFCDVAGADEEKAELEEVVEFLKDPGKFVKLGARIPRGVLLVGPPGTGKTLLAKAVAGEAGVPFFSISGSDFVEMYVGVGASRVRDLFDSARKTHASIIFIDEIDAVGRHRGAGLGGGHDEREQTLNQLLVEMDGFGTNSGVIVIAATNRPDILDPALLRPGRFDRRVTVNYPDMKGREEILKVHCRNKPLEETVDLKKIAQTTIGFSGAELANLMNEAALRAAKKNKALIGMEDIEESYMKLILGPQKKTKVRSEADNKLCAYHEAGHAVASYFCKHTDPVKHISIIPAGNAGGVTVSVPTEDRMGMSRNEMIDRIIVDLGGRVAEAIVLDDISTGASSDISHATKVARSMVTKYGMSEKLGTVLYDSPTTADEVFLGRDFSTGKDYSEQTAAIIDDEVRRIIAESYDSCKNILTENIAKLHFIAEFLLKNEVMDEEQFNAAMTSEDPTIEEIEKIALDRKSKSEEENKTAHEKNAEEERIKAEEALRAAEEAAKTVNNDLFAPFLEATMPKDEKDNDDSSNDQ